MYFNKFHTNIEKNNFDILTVYLYSDEKKITDNFISLKKNQKEQLKANDKKFDQIPLSLNSKQKTKLSSKNELKKNINKNDLLYKNAFLSKETQDLMKGLSLKQSKNPFYKDNKFSKPLDIKNNKKCLVSNISASHKPLQKVDKFDKNINISGILSFYYTNKFNSYMYKNVDINYLLSFKNRFNTKKNTINDILNKVKEDKKIVCF